MKLFLFFFFILNIYFLLGFLLLMCNWIINLMADLMKLQITLIMKCKQRNLTLIYLIANVTELSYDIYLLDIDLYWVEVSFCICKYNISNCRNFNFFISVMIQRRLIWFLEITIININRNEILSKRHSGNDSAIF